MIAKSASIYFDTDTFHNFAETFKDRPLASDLRERIVFSPMTLKELFSHLAVEWGPLVHQQIKGLPNWVNKDHAVLLPWMSDAVAKIAFGVPLPEDGFTKATQEDMNVLLNCELAEVFDIAKARRDELDRIKTEYAGHFKGTVEYFRKAPLTEDGFTEIWLAGLKKRLHLESNAKPATEIVDALSAYHEFELAKLKVALANENYNFEKHRNDLFDAEQLVYLKDANLHFLAIDRGYRSKVVKSPLRNKIHEVPRDRLADSNKAEGVLREIAASA
jgi:hypothetical protein